MAAYYVDSAAGGTNTGGSWTDAFLTLKQATDVATASDVIYVDDGHAETGTVAILYTLPATPGLSILSVDKALGLTPTAVSAGASVTQTSGSVGITFNGCAYAYGCSFLTSTAASISCTVIVGNVTSSATILTFESCVLHSRGASSSAHLNLGPAISLSNDENRVTLINTQIGVNHAGASVLCRGAKVRGIGVTQIGTAPTVLFETVSGGGPDAEFTGCDFSTLAYTNLVGEIDNTTGGVFRFVQCKLSVAGTSLTSAVNAPGGVEVFILDCATGDTHGLFGYANALGSVISDTGIYYTSGAAAQSWKIVTTANCSFYTPFETPWFGYYNSTLSAVTPYIEILRDGSATAYQDDEVWIDVLAKTTTGSTQSSLSTDRMALLGTPANQAAGAGTGSWTGENATAWSGKIGLGASVTPAEVGHIQARIVVGEPSITVYADPQIRT